MLEKHYLKMIEDTSEQISIVAEMLEQVAQGMITDNSTISCIQEQVVEFGSYIEREYALEDSEVIHAFERIAELLYLISSNSDRAYCTELSKLSNDIPAMLRNSKQILDSRMSLVLIIKNEAKYIKEWIEFHNMLGVDRFYIYDNDSTDNVEDILAEYIQKGTVVYQKWSGKVVQLSAYNHAINYYKYDTEYMGFIDADEFLFPIEGFSLPDTVDKIFDDYDRHIVRACNAGGIGVNWRSYGTSHHKEPIDGLVIDNYRLRAYDDYPQNVHIKVIVKPTLAKSFEYSPHNLFYNSPDCFTISEHGSVIPAAYFYDGHCEILRINHYYTRSEEELYYKMMVRGWANGSDNLQTEYTKNYEKRLVECNDIRDDIVDRFIDPLKERMNE